MPGWRIKGGEEATQVNRPNVAATKGYAVVVDVSGKRKYIAAEALPQNVFEGQMIEVGGMPYQLVGYSPEHHVYQVRDAKNR